MLNNVFKEIFILMPSIDLMHMTSQGRPPRVGGQTEAFFTCYHRQAQPAGQTQILLGPARARALNFESANA